MLHAAPDPLINSELNGQKMGTSWFQNAIKIFIRSYCMNRHMGIVRIHCASISIVTNKFSHSENLNESSLSFSTCKEK